MIAVGLPQYQRGPLKEEHYYHVLSMMRKRKFDDDDADELLMMMTMHDNQVKKRKSKSKSKANRDYYSRFTSASFNTRHIAFWSAHTSVHNS